MNAPSEHRLDRAFARLQTAREKGFIAYIACGDPDFSRTLDVAHCLEAAGVDVLELGAPFSDPLADGPVNQAASDRALRAGATTAGVLDCVRQFRETSQLPIVLYTYLNPLYAYGYERFLQDASASGIDALLVLDLPPDESSLNPELHPRVEALQMIRLIAPNTPPERVALVAAASEGFVYYVSREGVTGERQELAPSVGEKVAEIRRHTALPVAVGFGISTPEHARAAAMAADAVVVGSAIVRQVAQHPNAPERVGAFARTLAEATKSAR